MTRTTINQSWDEEHRQQSQVAAVLREIARAIMAAARGRAITVHGQHARVGSCEYTQAATPHISHQQTAFRGWRRRRFAATRPISSSAMAFRRLHTGYRITALLLGTLTATTHGYAAEPRADSRPADAPNAPVLAPPVVVKSAELTYPDGAAGSATVIVEAIVSADGRVESAHALEGVAPFAAAAEAAVMRYLFTPGTRGGVPLRARVRLLVAFEPPPSDPSLTVPAAAPAPATAVESPGPAASPSQPTAAPTPAAVEDVSVVGHRYETSSPTEHRLGSAEIRMLPGAFGDPFRAIEILPGIVPTVSGLPYFYIRGAPPAAVGYYVDEVRVPYLFHFGLGPGVIQPALISSVAVHPAAYPARFGRFSGGIVAGETKEPASTLTGEGLVRVYDAGAFVEAPIAGGKGHVAVGGRYSYTALLLSALLPGARIDYRDYNARFDYKLSDKWRFTAFAFGAFDYASDQSRGKERVLFASEFHRLDLRFDHESGSKSHSRIAATIGLDRTRLEGALFARDYPLGVRGRHRTVFSDRAELEVGADVLVDFFDGDLPSPYAVSKNEYATARSLYSPRTETSSGAWVSALLKPLAGPGNRLFNKLEMTLTARADVFTSDGRVEFGPSPRASMRVPLYKDVAALFALGVAPQTPAFAIPLPAVGYRGLPGGLSFAYQKSAGMEFKLPLDFTATAVGFHHSYFNMRDIFQNRDNPDVTKPQERINSPGQAYGLEVLIKRKMLKRVSATISYTLSRSELGSTAQRKSIVNLFDRTHVFQLAGAVDAGRNWFLSARSVYYTGWPQVQDLLIGQSASRLPYFLRFDARIEKRWTWGKRGHVSLIFEGLNVTGSKETLSQSCDAETGCTDTSFGPVVVPSIGVEGAL
jgi:TonB-dependent Receptor Plug Domain/Gram-negative bacterial TonB protein C-terminal